MALCGINVAVSIVKNYSLPVIKYNFEDSLFKIIFKFELYISVTLLQHHFSMFYQFFIFL